VETSLGGTSEREGEISSRTSLDQVERSNGGVEIWIFEEGERWIDEQVREIFGTAEEMMSDDGTREVEASSFLCETSGRSISFSEKGNVFALVEKVNACEVEEMESACDWACDSRLTRRSSPNESSVSTCERSCRPHPRVQVGGFA
jgi:hypothetical protein